MHYVLARVWLVRRHFDKAEAAIRESLALEPHDADYHTMFGQIQLHHSRWNEALAAAEQALACDAEHIDALNLRAEALRRLGRADSATEQLDEALRLNPEDAWTHASMGWTALEQGDRAKAKRHFREALRLDPELEIARRGVLESLKAWNPVYRLFLHYVFAMQRLSQRGQWFLIIGLWLFFNFVQGKAKSNPEWAPFLWPLVGLYIAFCFLSVLAYPLANLSLRLHPFGRLALSRDERFWTNWTGLLLLGAVGGGVAWLAGLSGRFAVTCLLLMLPVGCCSLLELKQARRWMVIYTLGCAVAGLAFVSVNVVGVRMLSWPPILVLPYALAMLIFPWAAILSPIAFNILSSITWRR